MDEKAFHEKLLDLIEQIKRFPEAKRESIEMLAGELGKKYEDLRKSLVMLQDTLDSLRLNVKYLLFDLQATKNENIALRKKLELQGNNKLSINSLKTTSESLRFDLENSVKD